MQYHVHLSEDSVRRISWGALSVSVKVMKYSKCKLQDNAGYSTYIVERKIWFGLCLFAVLSLSKMLEHNSELENVNFWFNLTCDYYV